MRTQNGETCRIRYLDKNWMIQLARASRTADKVIVKKCKATSMTMSFVRTVANDNGLGITTWDEDLVLEKRAQM